MIQKYGFGKINSLCKLSDNVPTLVDGGVCGSVDSATSYKRVSVDRRIN